MKKVAWLFGLELALVCCAWAASVGALPAHAPIAPVHGQIVTRANGTPAPGLKVFLIHPVLGRSVPSFTDEHGQFGWIAIPMRQEPYYIEVYWGEKLLYRQPVKVTGPLMIPRISL